MYALYHFQSYLPNRTKTPACDPIRFNAKTCYFVITTTSTVGYGDISPATEIEMIWENAVVLIGACFLAGIIGPFAACL